MTTGSMKSEVYWPGISSLEPSPVKWGCFLLVGQWLEGKCKVCDSGETGVVMIRGMWEELIEQWWMKMNRFRFYPVGNMEHGRSLNRIRMVYWKEQSGSLQRMTCDGKAGAGNWPTAVLRPTWGMASVGIRWVRPRSSPPKPQHSGVSLINWKYDKRSFAKSKAENTALTFCRRG